MAATTGKDREQTDPRRGRPIGRPLGADGRLTAQHVRDESFEEFQEISRPDAPPIDIRRVSSRIERRADPKGDRVVVTYDGKFLPYRVW